MSSLPFRFHAPSHTYTALDSGALLPNVTGLLEKGGWQDTEWYTEAGRVRGTAIHDLTAAYDLGALELAGLVSPYRPYLLGHALWNTMVRPEFVTIEEPAAHPTFRFAGRPDRCLRAYGVAGVCEGKSGGPERAHQVQTALQAILVAGAGVFDVPAELLGRWCLYWKPNGSFTFVEHKNKADFAEAYRLIKQYC